MIKISNLNKYFNKGKQNQIHVINDVNLELPQSGMVAIFGKSGCGKTTLLNVIGGLDGYESGAVTVEDNDISKNGDYIRNKYIGYIFQNYNLNKNQTCFENIASALRLCGINDTDILHKRVTAALTNVDMQNYAGRTPDTLSGGQQQRIAIARAIVKNPSIILVDEPTGNLDEANTVMIMDMLKEISRERLVILVTHEANLVDYYCDTVIELSDGKIISIKNNESASGFSARGKNDIYLGELQKTDITNDNAIIEYYGDAPETPVKLKIVNDGGKLYVRIDSPKVQIIDDTGEIKLREGVYSESEKEKHSAVSVNMSELPPIEGSNYGKLFNLKSALKSGYDSNFKKAKKGKKALRACMCMFAAVMVLMTAVFGTAFADLIDVQNSYNHNVFYVYTPDGDTSSKLVAAAADGNYGVDYIRLNYGIPTGDGNVKFMMGFFESFSFSGYDDGFSTNAVLLDTSLSDSLKVVAGKNEGLSQEDILISTKVADALLEKSSLGYVTEYDDLIGLITTSISLDGQNPRIAGVVDCNEPAVFMTEMAMAKYILRQSGLQVQTAEAYGKDIEKGSAVLALRYVSDGAEIPSVGETIKIHGKDIKISRIIKYSDTYEAWLKNNNVIKEESSEYFNRRYNEELSKGVTDEHSTLEYELRNKEYYNYLDYYYEFLDQYMEEKSLFANSDSIETWLYSEKGIEEMKYYNIQYGAEYYNAIKYKEENGQYPLYYDSIDTQKFYNDIDNYRQQYSSEFYDKVQSNSISSNTYFVNGEDYLSLSKQTGETHESAAGASGGATYYENEKVMYIGSSSDKVSFSTSAVGGAGQVVYTVIHSSDPSATMEWLESEFGGITPPTEYSSAMITPDIIFDVQIQKYSQQIITGVITIAVILVVLSICMYFIMRSSLLNRIKEVGIYRAIGVSKSNLIFKFFIETLLLTTLTVLIGFILTSGFIFACLGLSPMMESIFFYPVWIAAAVLAALYAICLFFGTLPITSLLRKTPSEILAKYDI